MIKHCLIFIISVLIFTDIGFAQADTAVWSHMGKRIWKKRVCFSAGTGVKYCFTKPERYVTKQALFEASITYFVNFGIYLSPNENSLLGVELKEFNVTPGQRINGQPVFLISSYFKRFYPVWGRVSLSPEINLSASTDVSMVLMLGLGIGVEYMTDYFNFFIKSSNGLVSPVSMIDKIPLPQFVITGVSVKF